MMKKSVLDMQNFSNLDNAFIANKIIEKKLSVRQAEVL